jgi:hypothetical protein
MRLKETICFVIILLTLTSFELSVPENQKIESKKKPALSTLTLEESHQKKSDTELKQKRLKAEIVKLQEESKKIKVEVIKLIEETKKLTSSSKNLRDWLTAIGGIITIIGSIIVVLLGFFFNRTLQSTQEKKRKLEESKMKQDKEFGREKHMLEVFKEFGAADPKVRIGAAAILIQRLKKIKEEGVTKNIENRNEFPMIVSVLISASKHEEDEKIQKYIADGIAEVLNATVPDEINEPDEETESPLKGYDFQGARLTNAWWKRIDARKVDFFEAHLKKAGLREAFLQKAVFMRADLTEAVLVGANLNKTNLQEAMLKNAILKDVDLSNSLVRGADFTGAVFNSGTILRQQQLTEATFSENISQVVTLID